MNHPDQAIDKLLAGLRDTEPPAGMERRILQAVETRALAPPPALSSRPITRWAVASACVLAAASTLAFYLAHRPVARAPFIASLPSAMSGPTLPSAALTPDKIRAHTSRAPFIAPLAMSGPTPFHARRPAHQTPQAAQPPTSASLPSLLAPPMPLTEQERLLLRIVHLGDPIEVAMLTTPETAAQKRQNDLDFERFFAPPAPPPPPQPIEIQTEAPEKIQGETQ